MTMKLEILNLIFSSLKVASDSKNVSDVHLEHLLLVQQSTCRYPTSTLILPKKLLIVSKCLKADPLIQPRLTTVDLPIRGHN